MSTLRFIGKLIVSMSLSLIVFGVFSFTIQLIVSNSDLFWRLFDGVIIVTLFILFYTILFRKIY